MSESHVNLFYALTPKGLYHAVSAPSLCLTFLALLYLLYFAFGPKRFRRLAFTRPAFGKTPDNIAKGVKKYFTCGALIIFLTLFPTISSHKPPVNIQILSAIPTASNDGVKDWLSGTFTHSKKIQAAYQAIENARYLSNKEVSTDKPYTRVGMAIFNSASFVLTNVLCLSIILMTPMLIMALCSDIGMKLFKQCVGLYLWAIISGFMILVLDFFGAFYVGTSHSGMAVSAILPTIGYSYLAVPFVSYGMSKYFCQSFTLSMRKLEENNPCVY